jgi:hypothetical protein
MKKEGAGSVWMNPKMLRPRSFHRQVIPGIVLFMVTLFFPFCPCGYGRDYGAEQAEEIRPLTFKELTAALDLRFLYQRDEQRSPDQKTFSQLTYSERETRFEERLDLKARGSVYHSNLLEFNLISSTGLWQDVFRGNFEDNLYKFVYEYDINLNFFKKMPYNFNLFTLRTSAPVSREFFESILVDNDLYGGIFRWRNNLFPVSLLLQSQSTKETSFDYYRNQTENTADLKITNNLAEVLKSELRYIYKDLVQQAPYRQETVTNNLSLVSSLEYNSIHGASNISYYSTSNRAAGFDFSTDQVQVNENFYVDHSKAFTTLYNYIFNHFRTASFSSYLNQGSIGFRHKLYDSLTTEVRGNVSLTNATGFRELYYGPSVSVSYQKNVPGGVFSAGYNFSYQRWERDAEAGIIQVFGERIVLSDGVRTFLANPNVVLGSVIVKDVNGLILTLNVDYRLIRSGTLTEIQRLALPNNTPVLVDYGYAFPRTLNYDSMTNGANLRYSFGQLLSLYYNYLSTRYLHIEQGKNLEVPASGRANQLYDILKSLYGAELKWRWFDVVGEYEDDNSDLIPFTAYRVRGNFNISPTDFLGFALTGNHSRTEYKRDGNRVSVDGGQANLNLRLNSFLETMLEGGYYREKGFGIDTRILGFKGIIKSRFRSIEMRLEPQYFKRHYTNQDRDELLIKFYFIRSFNII